MHKFRCTVVFFILLIWGSTTEAAYNSDYLNIQRQIYSLELDSALAMCDVKLQNQDVLAHFLKSKALFLKAVLLQSETDYEAFLNHNKKAKQSLSSVLLATKSRSSILVSVPSKPPNILRSLFQ